ncbi:hypothetical protein CLV32_4030 [Pedobacter duraquae]|uniref:DUF4252 domain-containing protein n=2 Tax=Pedobacter duraquae TaxID=425511 RepID=A0A4R6IDC0_9SPHI|nr:hypothetical protein CLV32_4030 [Pedobacter duraquae]
MLLHLMKTLFTLLFISCSTLCFAQRLTYKDLYFGLTHPITKTESQLVAKGFTYASTIDLDSTQHNKNRMYIKNGEDINYLSFAVMTFKNEIYGCTITTLKLEESNKLIEEIKTLGFKLKGSETYGKNLYTQYIKGQLEIEIQVGPTEIGYTMYNISLRDIAKTKEVYN